MNMDSSRPWTTLDTCPLIKFDCNRCTVLTVMHSAGWKPQRWMEWIIMWVGLRLGTLLPLISIYQLNVVVSLIRVWYLPLWQQWWLCPYAAGVILTWSVAYEVVCDSADKHSLMLLLEIVQSWNLSRTRSLWGHYAWSVCRYSTCIKRNAHYCMAVLSFCCCW